MAAGGSTMNRKTQFRATHEFPQGLMIALDVGSTAVKAVVVDTASDETLWEDYARHETRQLETCLDFLGRVEAAFPRTPREAFRVLATGSGGQAAGSLVGAAFVQEVNAVCLIARKRCPEARGIIELGGQDAKTVVFKPDPNSGSVRKYASMNDKCAGGTGAVIDKIAAKLGVSEEELGRMAYNGVKLHPVAGKCGVFAETDITGLQKQGVPPEELMASLFEAVVLQNLSVLTRGNTLCPITLLLGGPNCFIQGLRECWRHHLPRIWEERGIPLPAAKSIEQLVTVPEDALYFAALGAVEFAKSEVTDNPDLGAYRGTKGIEQSMQARRSGRHRGLTVRGLAGDDAETRTFKQQYAAKPWRSLELAPGSVIEGFIGVDGGSTSTKAVLVGLEKEVLAKAYLLSKGNPIQDTKEVLAAIGRQLEGQGCSLRVLGAATTGYAKDMLKDVIGADAALVETVAHTRSGLHYYPDADVICDVGGQDIKVIVLKNGAVKDFRLNTQCSAGNGYYLQATADAFGYSVEQYADVAFSARDMPEFNHGCAVFMQSDIVNFQRLGWQPHEIMAGLAAVLPKNVWLYVCQFPNLAQLGQTFVLQGGTQRNLAALKAQVDFIQSRFVGTGVTPKILAHEHCGEAGAIGAAFEARRLHIKHGRPSTFIGLAALRSFQYTTRRDETTRCTFCRNRCLRTFIDTEVDGEKRRLIVAACEKGSAGDASEARRIHRGIEATRAANPNLMAISARCAFEPPEAAVVADQLPGKSRAFELPRRRRAAAQRRELMPRRTEIRIGIPRVLNTYSYAPFFLGYFASLGVPPKSITWSDCTSEALYREGANRGAIDPCYPSKLAIPHVHNLLFHHAPLTHILFPMINTCPSWLDGTQANRACPTSLATPEGTYAAFIRERDVFAERGVCFKKTFVDLGNPRLCARQIADDWGPEIGVTESESYRAVLEGLRALERYRTARRREARAIIDRVEREQRLAIVVLARPYHNDPGINHGICEEFQRLGYPLITHDALPIDADMLDRLFGAEVAAGEIPSPLCIDDVWKNSYSENSSRKVWAAKYVARHPNLIGLELSSFKCGHDAPIYTVVEEIIECAGKPFFYFRDLDENKPASAIAIRVQTIAYFLRQYEDRLKTQHNAAAPHPPRRENALVV